MSDKDGMVVMAVQTLHLVIHSAFVREPTISDIFSHLSLVLAGYVLNDFSNNYIDIQNMIL